MSAAEMIIRLIDGSDSSQAAFDRQPTDSGQPQTIPEVGDTSRIINNSDMPSVSNASTDASSNSVGTVPSVSVPSAGNAELVSTVEGLMNRLDQVLISMNNRSDTAKPNSLDEVSTAQFARDVATFQQYVANEGKSNQEETPSTPKEGKGKKGGETDDGLRDLRNSIIELSRMFVPGWLSGPIEKLINTVLTVSRQKPSQDGLQGQGSVASKTANSPSAVSTTAAPISKDAPPANGLEYRDRNEEVSVTVPQVQQPGQNSGLPGPIPVTSTGTGSTPTTPQVIPSATVPTVQAIGVPSVQSVVSQPSIQSPPQASTPPQSSVPVSERIKSFTKRQMQRTLPGRQLLRGARRVRSVGRQAAKRIASSAIGKRVASISRKLASSAPARAVAAVSRNAVSTVGSAVGTVSRIVSTAAGAAGAVGAAGGAGAAGAAGGAGAAGAAGGAAAGGAAAGVAPIAGTGAGTAGAAVATTRAAASAAITGGAGAAASVAFGAAIAAVPAPIAIAVGALGAFALAVHSATEDLQDFSSDVAASKARGQINTEMNRLDRAERVGPELGQVNDAKNRVVDQSQKLLTDILNLGLKLTPLFSKIADGVTLAIGTLQAQLNVLDAAAAGTKVAAAAITPDGQDDVNAAKELREVMQRGSEIRQGMADALQNLFGGNQPNNNQGRDPDLQALLNGRNVVAPPQRRKLGP